MEIKNREIISYFSLDKNKEVSGVNFDGLRHINVNFEGQSTKKVYYDLNKTDVEFYDYSRAELSHGERAFKWLLQGLLLAKPSVLKPGETRLSAEFVFSNGVGKKLLASPADDQSITLRATKYKGTIYLVRVNPAEPRNSYGQMCTVWGEEFENKVTSGTKHKEFRVLLKYDLGDKHIIQSYKVDAVDHNKFDKDFKNLSDFVEILTSKDKFGGLSRYKARGIWAQNYLVGVPKLVCGMRSEKGIVHTLKSLRVADLPMDFTSLTRKSPGELVRIMDQTLEAIKTRVKVDDYKLCYEIKVRRGSVVSCTETSEALLTEDFVEGMFGKGAEEPSAFDLKDIKESLKEVA